MLKKRLSDVIRKKFIMKWLLMAVVFCFINVIVFCNLSTCVPGGYGEKSLYLSKLGTDSENADLQADGSVRFGSLGGVLHLVDVNCEIRSITIVTDSLQDKIADGIIFLKDEGHAYGYFRNQTFRLNKKYNTVTRPLISQGKCSELKLDFGICDKGVVVKEIILNKHEGFRFRLSTYLLMLLLGTALLWLKEQGYLKAEMDLSKKSQRWALLLGILAPIGMALFISIASCRQGETLLFPYEKGNIDEMPMQQMMLFDSFHHGSVRIDVDVDPDYLLMDNIYDETERAAKDFDTKWDLAFYNGSYYSYFGSLPILVLYEICYILTGCLPGVNFSMFIVSLFGIIGFFAATYQFLKYFKVKPSLFDFILGNWALMTASFFFLTSVNSDQYSLPIIFCLAFLLFGIATAYAAVMEKNRIRKRIVLYILCGICLVGVVMLRPAVLLMFLAFVMPLFIGVLLDKEMNQKEKVRDVASFAVPVVLGAVVVMLYNYLRFDSPFEFGARYQLTVSDIRYNHTDLNLNTILATIYHYGFEGLNFKSYFPFLFFSMDPTITYGKLVYHEAVMGVFVLPFNLLAFGLLGFTKRKKSECKFGQLHEKNLERYTLWTVFLVSLLLMLLDFGMGGLVGRYVADFAIGFAFVAFVMWMKVSAGCVATKAPCERGMLYGMRKVGYCVIAVTLIMGFLLLFSNDPIKFQIARENPDIYLFFANLFDI